MARIVVVIVALIRAGLIVIVCVTIEITVIVVVVTVARVPVFCWSCVPESIKTGSRSSPSRSSNPVFHVGF